MTYGNGAKADRITHMAQLNIAMGDTSPHLETALAYIAEVNYDLVLGRPWLATHTPEIDWLTGAVDLNSSHCRAKCLAKPPTIFPYSEEDSEEIDLQEVSLHAIATHAQEEGAKTYPMWIQPTKDNPLAYSATSAADFEKFMTDKPRTDPLEKLPAQHRHLAKAFDRDLAKELPPTRPGIDLEINLKEGTLPHKNPYPMSPKENEAIKKWLDDQLAQGFIKTSSSPTAAPVIVVRKPSGGLRVCVDYRALNALTIKNRYPIPLVRETLSKLSGKQYFTKLDVISAFNRIRIAEGHEWKTAFNTRYGQFECLVMPFGLSNAPASFQSYINDVLREFLDAFASAYLDDVLIYSDTLEEHIDQVNNVLEKLIQAKLPIDIDKCEFHTQSTRYLGLIISNEGIRMDPAKVEAIQEWETPRTVKDVQAFLGFANFYRQFIFKYSKLAAPLTAITRNGPNGKPVFSWTPEADEAFQALKHAFTTDPILAHFEPGLKTMIETDASDSVVACVASQEHVVNGRKVWRPVAYFSKKMSPAERNYDIYDKELLAIVKAFDEYRPELTMSEDEEPVKVVCDHKNLEYFMTTKRLNSRQARWSEFLSQFNFVITFRPGKANERADALTWRTQDAPSADTLSYRDVVLIKPHQVDPNLSATDAERGEDANEEELSDIVCDKEYQRMAKDIKLKRPNATITKAKIDHDRCTVKDDKVYLGDRLWVPKADRITTLRTHHDAPAAGHPGVSKTLELIRREHYWPRMSREVKRYVAACRKCRVSKAPHSTTDGLLKPMPPGDSPWKEIAIDFVVELPKSKAEGMTYTNVLTVTDRFTKARVFIPVGSMTARNTARLFLRHVFSKHGLPEAITSDRGPQFVSNFWRELCQSLGVEQRLSSAFHPQTDGQSERTNRDLEQYLRAYVNYAQSDWVEWLPLAEFAINNHVSDSTRVTPFYANHGRHPRFTIDTSRPSKAQSTPAKLDEAAAKEFASRMKDIHEALTEELTLAQEVQAETANQRRTFWKYVEGDQVFINTQNIRSTRPSKKLDYKFIGPYPITKAINEVTYRVDLPKDLQIHDTFHCSLLQPASEPLDGQVVPPPPPVVISRDNQEQEEYEVKEILDSRIKGRAKQFEYRVRWTGYDDITWERLSDVLPGAEALARAFHAANPSKPRPSTSILPPAHEDTDTDLEDDSAFAVSYLRLQGTSST